MLHFLLIVGLWAGLTIMFMFRFRNILTNLGDCVKPGGWASLPKFNIQPVKQLACWIAELLMLVLFYSVFGQAMLAHVVAAICCGSLMIMLRDKTASDLLHSVQLLPDSTPLPKWLGASA